MQTIGQRAPASAPSQGGVDPQRRLVEALREPRLHGAPCREVALIETHISYVLLTGTFAYKIRKAIRLAFLDFGTLEARRADCERELRLNRRLAPSLYLDVVPITGAIDRPALGGAGPVLEYAVRMREFAQEALLSAMVERGELSRAHVDALAARIAAFHAEVDRAPADGDYGDPAEALRLALDNFAEIGRLCGEPGDRAALDGLQAWTGEAYEACRTALAERRRAGLVRECHGDLHLGNVALVDGDIVIFDCIEFDDRLRWIDVASEIAFTVMDLADRGRPDLAHRLLSTYLERTGDYDGCRVLRFQLVYRAMVRAKVTLLRAVQLGEEAAATALRAQFRGYLALARTFAMPPRPSLVAMHGLSGSGKSTVAQAIVERTGAIRIRTDVERKRLHGLAAGARSGSGVAGGLYTEEATRATYAHVAALARSLARSGFSALVDGTLSKRWQRDALREAACAAKVPFVIVDVRASEATSRRRVAERALALSDPSEADLAVLEHQLASEEPLGDDELRDAVRFDGECTPGAPGNANPWLEAFERLGRPTRSAQPPRRNGSVPDEELGFLARAASYPERTSEVERIETHMSWLFLTDRHVWKLKKRVRSEHVDLRDVRARRANCEQELRLNRRLSDDVYLGVVALSRDADGTLSLGGAGEPIDWLVKMRRLPAATMLDRMIQAGTARPENAVAVARRLCAFYRTAPPVTMSCERYRARLARAIEADRAALSLPLYALPVEAIERTCAIQLAFVRESDALDERVRAGRIVEGHGDLRPEHVSLEAVPQIIDCLEFSRELRLLDPADELAYLALECERLGAAWLAKPIFATYAQQTRDRVPQRLLQFHASNRALVRARIAIRHLDDAEILDPGLWSGRARHYLRLAQAHAEAMRAT